MRGLRLRMYLGLCIVCVIVVAIVVTVFISYSHNERRLELERYYSEKADNTAARLDDLLREMNTVSVQLRSSGALQDMFVAANTNEYSKSNYFLYNLEDKKDAQDIIWTFAAARSDIAGINIFSGPTYVGMRNMPSAETARGLSNQEKWQIESGSSYKITGPHYDEWDSLQNREVISLIRSFEATNYSFVSLGTIEVQAHFAAVEEICGDNLTNTMSTVILNSEGKLIYDDESVYQELINYIGKAGNGVFAHFSAALAEDGKQLFHTGIEWAGWHIFVLEDEAVFSGQLGDIIRLTLLIALPVTIFLLFCMALAVRQVTKPVLALAHEVEMIAPNGEGISFTKSNIIEIEILQNVFLATIEKLKEAAVELRLASETELNLRIGALQAQINPHFLFNSLSAISAVGTEENSEKIPLMCYQLSELFRYAGSDGTSLTTLVDEMRHIGLYIDFAKWRYEDNLDSEIICKGDLSEVSIARLCLQPLVENCFTHGFKGAFPPHRLRVDCQSTSNGWHFIIADSGSGFSEETVAEISKKIMEIDEVLLTKQGYGKLKTNDMAILNLYIRLKLQYGRAFYIEVLKDHALGGALVKIVVDYSREGGMTN